MNPMNINKVNNLTVVSLVEDRYFTKGELLHVVQGISNGRLLNHYITTRVSVKQTNIGWYINARHVQVITKETNPEYFL